MQQTHADVNATLPPLEMRTFMNSDSRFCSSGQCVRENMTWK